MLLLLMAIDPPAPIAPAAEPPRLATSSEKCATAANRRPDEIVVCGRRGESYRIEPTAGTPAPTLPPASFRLSANASITLGADQQDIGGHPSQRAVLTIKIRF